MSDIRIHEFHKEELFDNITIEKIYASTFIRCIFRNCHLALDASYVKFLDSQFIDCHFGKYTRNKRSIAYKCNFDKSYFNQVRGLKFKACSLNGTKIDKMVCCTIVKCSDKYLTIMDAEDSDKVTHSDRTFKVVTMNSTKQKDVRNIQSGSTNNNSETQ